MSADSRDRANGRDPLLSPLPPPRPVLTEAPRVVRGGWEELARGYASVAASTNQHLPAIYRELDQHRAAINLLPERLDVSVRSAIAAERQVLRDELRREVRTEVASVPRERMPSASEIAQDVAKQLVGFDPDLTPAGGIRLDGDAWTKVVQRLEAQEKAIAEHQKAAEIAKAKEEGASKAIEGLKGSIKWWVFVATVVMGILTWVVTHFGKL